MIITLAEVKNLLSLDPNDNTKDSLISELIPIAQERIIEHTNNFFLNCNIQLVSSTASLDNNSITDSNNSFIDSGFQIGNIKITAKFNNSVFTLSNIDANVLTVAETLVNESGNTIVITQIQFPKSIKPATATYINFLSTPKGKLVKSETIGHFSASYKDECEVLALFSQWRKPYR